MRAPYVRLLLAIGVGAFGVPEYTETPLVAAALAQACHSSYSNVCISPNGGDVDCAGGGGNGPRYVRGPVYVVGPDTYRLDRDGDGVACERR